MILSVRIWSTVETKQKGKGEFLERFGGYKDPVEGRNRKAGMSFIFLVYPLNTEIRDESGIDIIRGGALFRMIALALEVEANHIQTWYSTAAAADSEP
ncbi:hypothetical protein E5D57_009448 [Metarhizium anisopliae]|nr:hypothetical protein E5D57_009448 [Metarhizium anisopliae]